MSLDSPATPAGMVLGYAHGRTGAVSLESQIDVLVGCGVDAGRIYTDETATRPPPHASRPGFSALLDYARPGDTVVVPGIDCLGRTRSEVLDTTRVLTERGIGLRALREDVDSSDVTGAKIIGVLASLGAAGDGAARSRRTRGHPGHGPIGRPRSLTDEQILLAERLRANGAPVPDIASELGVSRATLYRTLAERRSTS